MIASLFFLGRLRQLNEVVPPLLADAEARGNLYATMSFRTAYAWVGPLARGDIDEARHQLQLARREWQATVFQLSHWNIIVGETYIDLYASDALSAWKRAAEQRAKVRAAGLIRIGIVATQMWQLSGASAAAYAEALRRRGDSTAARARYREARRAIARLCRTGIPRARPLAWLIEAAIEAATGASETSQACLERAIEEFDALQMVLFAAAARARLAALVGDSPMRDTLQQRAQQVFEEQQVLEPSRMLEMLAPGFPPVEARGSPHVVAWAASHQDERRARPGFDK
jgi:hypothetical protein